LSARGYGNSVWGISSQWNYGVNVNVVPAELGLILPNISIAPCLTVNVVAFRVNRFIGTLKVTEITLFNGTFVASLKRIS
jgi:hypothetical protein